jgi:hypothetical protein
MKREHEKQRIKDYCKKKLSLGILILGMIEKIMIKRLKRD